MPGGRGGSPGAPPAPCCPPRIALRRMPSIRQTLREMGVKVREVFPELRRGTRGAGDGPRNGTAPTLLTNYLDVSVTPPRGGFVTPMSPGSRGSARGEPCPTLSPPRPNISARSASGPPRRPSRWSLTRARPTCGCRPTSAPPSTAPVVSRGVTPQKPQHPLGCSERAGEALFGQIFFMRGLSVGIQTPWH